VSLILGRACLIVGVTNPITLKPPVAGSMSASRDDRARCGRVDRSRRRRIRLPVNRQQSATNGAQNTTKGGLRHHRRQLSSYIRPMGGQVPRYTAPQTTIRASEAGDNRHRRSIFRAVYSRSRSVTRRWKRGSSCKICRCGSARKKGQQGFPESALRSNQPMALSVFPSTA
jgi:hypothetical protein